MVTSRLHRNTELYHAGTYTSMDVGRLFWTFGVAMGQYGNQHLDKETFRILVSMQGSNTQKLYAELGIDHTAFSALHRSLANSAVSWNPPPEWAAPESRSVLFPGLLVHVCEYSETCGDVRVGRAGILLATSKALSHPERIAVRLRVDSLLEQGKGNTRGQRGRCHMSLVVETVMDFRGGYAAAAELLAAASAPQAVDRLQEIVDL